MDPCIDATICKAAREVHAYLGGGLSESIYQKAISIELRDQGYDIENEVVIPVFYKTQYVGFVRADVVVEKYIILELKVAPKITDAHMLQLSKYTKWNNQSSPDAGFVTLGAVVNFGVAGVEVRFDENSIIVD
tara:strand:+ start:975 stop:1373 length:399 start_codon:yes stop_codon:yes gene_type:complete